MRDDGLTGVQESIIKNSEETWTISGTSTTAQLATTVTLEAKNKEGEPVSPVTTEFKWTVEAVPTIGEPPSQASTVGKAITPLRIKGTNLSQLTPAILPAGLELNPAPGAEQSEWL